MMERLTFEGTFCDISQCESTPGGSYCKSGSCSQREVWERLKAYEDTGLTPEECAEYKKFEDEIIASGKSFGRLIELLNADREGRMVVLPCKRGDTVYCIRHNVRTGRRWVRASTVRTVTIWDPGRYCIFTTKGDWLGKTVFLTREEAEEALRRAGDER